MIFGLKQLRHIETVTFTEKCSKSTQASSYQLILILDGLKSADAKCQLVFTRDEYKYISTSTVFICYNINKTTDTTGLLIYRFFLEINSCWASMTDNSFLKCHNYCVEIKKKSRDVCLFTFFEFSGLQECLIRSGQCVDYLQHGYTRIPFLVVSLGCSPASPQEELPVGTHPPPWLTLQRETKHQHE